MHNLLDVISEIYASGIDCGLETYRGRGITAWVVNDRNRRVERRFAIDDAQGIAEWLQREAGSQRIVRHAHGGGARALLGELAGSERKGPKQVTSAEYRRRQTGTDNDLR
jgi:hypothetical protein